MIRQIIKIDEEKCTGCGLCATACHEGAIDIVDGKAKLVREHYCDGLGDCLPACPVDAIHFEHREAPAYDEAAVKAHMERRKQEQAATQASDTHSSAVQEDFTCFPRLSRNTFKSNIPCRTQQRLKCSLRRRQWQHHIPRRHFRQSQCQHK